jgi:hypothetical protein
MVITDLPINSSIMMDGGFTEMTKHLCVIVISAVTLQTLGGQSTSPQTRKAPLQPGPSPISMPYSITAPMGNGAWRGTLTVSDSEITQQGRAVVDSTGTERSIGNTTPIHHRYEQMRYCSFYDNRSESITPPSYLGTTSAGRKIAYHGYGPSLWIIVKHKDGGYEGFAIPSDYARQFYLAAKDFGKHCGPSTPEIKGVDLDEH